MDLDLFQYTFDFKLRYKNTTLEPTINTTDCSSTTTVVCTVVVSVCVAESCTVLTADALGCVYGRIQ